MMYYFLSVVADISSSPYINASAIYFAPNASYSPSYRANFNQTFPLFAPRAFRYVATSRPSAACCTYVTTLQPESGT